MIKGELISSLSLPISFVIGLLFSILLSITLCPKILNYALKDEDDKIPRGITKSKWISITHESKSGGKVLGALEAAFFFISFWISHPELVAVWLVFKVGSKWEIWNNIIKVPENIQNVNDLEYLDARHKWGTKILMRFLIGTIANILIAMLGTTVSDGIQQLLLFYIQ